MGNTITSGFNCLYCGESKSITIDLNQRQIYWTCLGCGQEAQTMVMNIKQKDIDKLSIEEVKDLVDLIQVSLHLHEPVLAKNWPELLENKEAWAPWLNELKKAGRISLFKNRVVSE